MQIGDGNKCMLNTPVRREIASKNGWLYLDTQIHETHTMITKCPRQHLICQLQANMFIAVSSQNNMPFTMRECVFHL